MIVNEDSIVPHDHQRKVKSSDVTFHEFLETSPPPKANASGPKYDTTDCLKLHDRGTKYLRAELKT